MHPNSGSTHSEDTQSKRNLDLYQALNPISILAGSSPLHLPRTRSTFQAVRNVLGIGLLRKVAGGESPETPERSIEASSKPWNDVEMGGIARFDGRDSRGWLRV